MALSSKTIGHLADTLSGEVVEYILEDERWTEFLIEMISDAIVAKMGTLDCDLHGDLAYAISERIVMTSVCHLFD